MRAAPGRSSGGGEWHRTALLPSTASSTMSLPPLSVAIPLSTSTGASAAHSRPWLNCTARAHRRIRASRCTPDGVRELRCVRDRDGRRRGRDDRRAHGRGLLGVVALERVPHFGAADFAKHDEISNQVRGTGFAPDLVETLRADASSAARPVRTSMLVHGVGGGTLHWAPGRGGCAATASRCSRGRRRSRRGSRRLADRLRRARVVLRAGPSAPTASRGAPAATPPRCRARSPTRTRRTPTARRRSTCRAAPERSAGRPFRRP